MVIAHNVSQAPPHVVREVCREPQIGVLADDRRFDLFDDQVRQVAEALLPPAAEVVLVALAPSTAGDGVDQPTVAASLPAAFTEKHALEVVVVDAVAISPRTPGLQDFLHTLEQLVADYRLVPAEVLRRCRRSHRGSTVAQHLV